MRLPLFGGQSGLARYLYSCNNPDDRNPQAKIGRATEWVSPPSVQALRLLRILQPLLLRAPQDQSRKLPSDSSLPGHRIARLHQSDRLSERTDEATAPVSPARNRR